MYYIHSHWYLINRLHTASICTLTPCLYVMSDKVWACFIFFLSFFIVMEEKTNICYHFHAATAITHTALEFIYKNMNSVLFSTWVSACSFHYARGRTMGSLPADIKHNEFLFRRCFSIFSHTTLYILISINLWVKLYSPTPQQQFHYHKNVVIVGHRHT